MTKQHIPDERLHVKPGVVLGPRLTHDIRRRVRQLESRLPHAMTRADWHELSRLRDLLRLVAAGGGRDD